LRKIFKRNPAGVLYNIIRRSGLKQSTKESITEFGKRCVEDIQKRPDFYFIRMEVLVSPEEMRLFELELEDIIVDFMNWWQGISGHYKCSDHCINKYGHCQYLPLCSGKRFNQFVKRSVVFRELEAL
jgi:hypothetical protein